MVPVGGRFCIDRFEMSLIDANTQAAWSPYYPPNVRRAQEIQAFYTAQSHEPAAGLVQGAMFLPTPTASVDAIANMLLRLPPAPTETVEPLAVSAQGVVPQGYLSALDAKRACENASKRLCTESEWVTACRGDRQADFPYGAQYERGACNVYRESHPSFLLHGNAARFHDDPRNNLVQFEGQSLLRLTGDTDRCISSWGRDGAFDMVGNLDEWVESDGFVFVGGFYSRGTKSGCRSRVPSHTKEYADYSTGGRCCRAPLPSGS